MNKQELIDCLLDCSRRLAQLAEHLQNWQPPDEVAPTDIAADTIAKAVVEAAPDEAVDTVNDAVIDVNTVDVEPAAPPAPTVKASAANPFARLFAGLNPGGTNLPAGSNPFNLLNMLGGGMPGFGSGNLPTTLAELHDNPQIMNILSQVAGNPQSLNMLSSLTGQSPAALQGALNSLQPTVEATPAAATPAAPAPIPAAAAAPMPAVPSATAHLDNLLAEWHWGPYARVWAR